MREWLKGIPVQSRRLPIWVFCLLIAQACANAPVVPPQLPEFSLRNDALFGVQPQLISTQDIHKLTQAQESAFFQFVNGSVERNNPAHERVMHYLLKVLKGFEYQNTTFTAAETLARGQGNCLSLAILTTALAKLANVPIGYQLADSSPVYALEGSIVVKGVHIRIVLFDKGWQAGEDKLVSRLGSVRIDYFPSGTERFLSDITEQQYIARYYRNLAVRALAVQDYTRSYWLTVQSMEIEPLSADALNTLAVVYRRAGHPIQAEAIFRYGTRNIPDDLSMLKNYRYLLAQQKRSDEVAALGVRIAALDDPSPFYLYQAAYDFYENKNYREAIRMYKKAIAVAPYLHEARLGLSLSYYQLAHKRMAERELHAAIERAHVPETRSLYEAKLMALSGRTNNKSRETGHE